MEANRIANLVNDFKTLALVGQNLKDVPTILKRVANLPSVTQAVEALALEPKSEEQRGSLVDQLLDHPDTFHVGALVTNLISGLQISFHASLPSEQPLGGVADITNKGSFDKLLTSEYAFDEHILLSRLANSEALYKHREVPPADNTFTRVLLIDITLKNWGTIRTISFATALAIARHPKNKDPYRIFLVGESYREIAVDTVLEVIDGLTTLDGTLDPGVGIEQLFSHEDLRASEVFFIGTADSVASPTMQRLSSAAGRHIDHWIHPDERGLVRVYKHPKRGKRFVQKLTIPLDKAWSRPTPPTTAGASTTSYPILFPEMKMKATWTGDRFTYGTTKYKGLLRLYAGRVNTTHGWEFITGDVRPRDNLKAVITHEDLSVTVLFATDTKEYTLVTYPEGERITVALDRRMHKAKIFYVENDCFAADLSQTTIYIDRQGHITESAILTVKKKSDKVFRNKDSNFFRHLTRIYITEDDKLRIRKHDLLLINGAIRIHHRVKKSDIKLTATEKEPGVFAFPDGSCVTHDSNGILTLTSANPTLPVVYLPIQLDTDLGVATVDDFAGNTYYQKKPRITFIVNNPGDETSVANIIIQRLRWVSLRQVEDMVDDGLIVCADEASLAELTSSLAGYPFRVHGGGVHQRVVTPTEFYQQYIEPFITHIVNHGTNA